MKGLHEHLQKCEIEYIAAHGGGYPEALRGLTGEAIVKYLRRIGFRIKERFEAEEGSWWVRTTGGIAVNIESPDDYPCGFVHKSLGMDAP